MVAVLIGSVAFTMTPGNVRGATYVSSDIWIDTTWDLAGSPWIIAWGIPSIITVHKGATLTIEAGVSVYFDPMMRLVIEGNLTAVGTAQSHISFTGNGTPILEGVTVRGSGHARMDYLDVAYADMTEGGIRFENANDSRLGNVTVSSGGPSLWIEDSDNITIADSKFSGSYGGTAYVKGEDNSFIRSRFEDYDPAPALRIDESNRTVVADSYLSARTGISLAVLEVSASHNNTIVNNTIRSSDLWSSRNLIRLTNSSDNLIVRNSFSATDSSTVPRFVQSSRNRFENNTYVGSPSFPVEVSLEDSERNVLANNTYDFGTGGPTPQMKINLENSSLNAFANNILKASVSLSFVNGSLQNSFLRNDLRQPLGPASFAGTEFLNDTCSGNRYSDYDGGDWNGDGIGDTPVAYTKTVWDMKPIIVPGSCYSPGQPAVRIPPGITRVTSDPAKQVNAMLYGNVVAWSDYRGASPGIYYHDFEGGQTRIAPVPASSLADFFKDRMAYVKDDRIYEYQITLNRTVLHDPSGPHYTSPAGGAKVSDLYVAWIEDGVSIWGGAYAELESSTTNTVEQLWGGPEVALSDQYLAMVRYTGHWTGPELCSEVFVRNLTTGQETQVTQNYGTDCDPVWVAYVAHHLSVSGDRLVWSQLYVEERWPDPPVYGDEDVFLYDARTHNSSLLAGGPSNQIYPHIYGDRVAYADDSRGDYDVVILNITTGQSVRLRREGGQVNPSLYENLVAWEDNRDGQWDIYVANLSFFVGDVDAVPDPQDLPGNVTISCTVPNVRATGGVFVEIREPTGGLLENVSMVVDGGGAYHYRRPYSEVGRYSFKISAVDDLGQWVSENGSFVVRDIDGPTLTQVHATPRYQEAGLSVNVSAVVADPSGVAGAWLEVTYPSGAVVNSSMIPGPASEYHLNSSYIEPGTYPFTIRAEDSLGNWNSEGTWFNVYDSIAPDIFSVNVNPNPQEPNMPVNISARVTDVVQVANVNITVAGPGLGEKWPMTRGEDDVWYFARSYSSVGDYVFRINATDSTGNVGKFSGNFSIIDSKLPVISALSVQPNPVRVFSPVVVEATVTDNDAVDSVSMDIFPPGGPSTRVQMARVAGDLYRGTFSTTVLGTHNVTVRASDPSGNEAVSATEFSVIDDLPPVVDWAVAIPDPQEVHGLVNITASASDNYMMESVSLNVLNPNGTWTNATMSFVGMGAYELGRTYDELGTFRFTVVAMDTSGLDGKWSGEFRIVDTTAPFAYAGPDRVVMNGTVVEMNASLSYDNYRIAEYRWDFTYAGAPVTLYGVKAFWPFALAGIYSIRLNVTDTSGNIGSDILVITVRPRNLSPRVTQVIVTPQSPEYGLAATFRADVAGADVAGVHLEVWDPVGVSVFNVTMNFEPLSGTATHASAFSKLGVFTYCVSAESTAGLWGTAGGWFQVIDTTPPRAVAGPDRTVERGQPFEMNGSASTDNVGIASYEWTWSANGTEYSESAMTAQIVFSNPGSYTVTLVVEDSSGNKGSAVVRITVVDTIAPAQPQAVRAYVVSDGVVVTWAPNTEDDLAGYEIMRSVENHGLQLLATVNASHTSYFDTDVTNGTRYVYVIRALDLYGHASEESESASVVLPTAERPVGGTEWWPYAAVALLAALGAVLFMLMFRRLWRKGREPRSPREKEELNVSGKGDSGGPGAT